MRMIRAMQNTAEGAIVLVVEDEMDMARILELNLEHIGCVVSRVASGREARAWLADHRPDLVLLDLRLPDIFGVDLLVEMRQAAATRHVPVLVVSAIGDEETVVQALNQGATDYVVKPFRTRELLARVAAALRRSTEESGDEQLLTVGSITVDVERRKILVAGKEIDFTRTEFDLVHHFCANPDRVFTRKQLCDDPLGTAGAVQERTIDAHIRTIRRKLGDAGRMLVTVWGVGYKLVAEE